MIKRQQCNIQIRFLLAAGNLNINMMKTLTVANLAELT